MDGELVNEIGRDKRPTAEPVAKGAKKKTENECVSKPRNVGMTKTPRNVIQRTETGKKSVVLNRKGAIRPNMLNKSTRSLPPDMSDDVKLMSRDKGTTKSRDSSVQDVSFVSNTQSCQQLSDKGLCIQQQQQQQQRVTQTKKTTSAIKTTRSKPQKNQQIEKSCANSSSSMPKRNCDINEKNSLDNPNVCFDIDNRIICNMEQSNQTVSNTNRVSNDISGCISKPHPVNICGQSSQKQSCKLIESSKIAKTCSNNVVNGERESHLTKISSPCGKMKVSSKTDQTKSAISQLATKTPRKLESCHSNVSMKTSRMSTKKDLTNDGAEYSKVAKNKITRKPLVEKGSRLEKPRLLQENGTRRQGNSSAQKTVCNLKESVQRMKVDITNNSEGESSANTYDGFKDNQILDEEFEQVTPVGDINIVKKNDQILVNVKPSNSNENIPAAKKLKETKKDFKSSKIPSLSGKMSNCRTAMKNNMAVVCTGLSSQKQNKDCVNGAREMAPSVVNITKSKKILDNSSLISRSRPKNEINRSVGVKVTTGQEVKLKGKTCALSETSKSEEKKINKNSIFVKTNDRKATKDFSIRAIGTADARSPRITKQGQPAGNAPKSQPSSADCVITRRAAGVPHAAPCSSVEKLSGDFNVNSSKRVVRGSASERTDLSTRNMNYANSTHRNVTPEKSLTIETDKAKTSQSMDCDSDTDKCEDKNSNESMNIQSTDSSDHHVSDSGTYTASIVRTIKQARTKQTNTKIAVYTRAPKKSHLTKPMAGASTSPSVTKQFRHVTNNTHSNSRCVNIDTTRQKHLDRNRRIINTGTKCRQRADDDRQTKAIRADVRPSSAGMILKSEFSASAQIFKDSNEMLGASSDSSNSIEIQSSVENVATIVEEEEEEEKKEEDDDYDLLNINNEELNDFETLKLQNCKIFTEFKPTARITSKPHDDMVDSKPKTPSGLRYKGAIAKSNQIRQTQCGRKPSILGLNKKHPGSIRRVNPKGFCRLHTFRESTKKKKVPTATLR